MEEERITAIQIVKEEVRLQAWQEDVKAQQTSGLTVREWCSQNGVTKNAFYYRLRKIRSKLHESSPAIVPVKSAGVPISQDAGITLVKDGLNIKLPPDISAEILIAV